MDLKHTYIKYNWIQHILVYYVSDKRYKWLIKSNWKINNFNKYINCLKTILAQIKSKPIIVIEYYLLFLVLKVNNLKIICENQNSNK